MSFTIPVAIVARALRSVTGSRAEFGSNEKITTVALSQGHRPGPLRCRYVS